MTSNERYKNLEYKASGVFGIVCSAIDSTTGDKVAIKVIQLEFYRKDEFKRILREMNILKHLNSRYSLWLCDVFKHEKNNHLSDVSLVMPHMEFDLRNILCKYNLRYIQIIKIVYQLLLALKYLYDAGIIHRDLKPSNIGINGDMNLRLLDFGLAREINGDMTEYVVARWYRPIEVFCDPNYSTAVDMWSAGCIFSELFTGQVLFKGTGQVDQVTKIIAVTGFPDDKLLLKSQNENTIKGLELYRHLAAKRNMLEEHISNDINQFVCDEDEGDQLCSEQVIALICQMLDLDPDNRPTPEEALRAPLFDSHRKHVTCYEQDSAAKKYSFPYDLNNESEESLQKLIIEEIEGFTPRH